MRKGFSLTEIMVVIIILPFVFFVLDGLFGTLLTEVPRSWRVAQQGSILLNLVEQIHRDVEEAKALPAESAGQTAGDKLLLVKLADGVFGYQIEKGRVTRSWLANAPPSEQDKQRIWTMPAGEIEWQVWQKDGRPYAVEVKTHVEFKFHGRTEEKMARASLFYAGVLR